MYFINWILFILRILPIIIYIQKVDFLKNNVFKDFNFIILYYDQQMRNYLTNRQ